MIQPERKFPGTRCRRWLPFSRGIACPLCRAGGGWRMAMDEATTMLGFRIWGAGKVVVVGLLLLLQIINTD